MISDFVHQKELVQRVGKDMILYIKTSVQDMHAICITDPSVGKKVEEEDNNLPRSVMLAFNLELNKDGTFCKRRRNDTPNNMSSYELAENVISLFYGSP